MSNASQVGAAVAALAAMNIGSALYGQCTAGEQEALTAPTPGVAYQLGRGVAVDGNVAVVGEADNNPGSVYVFRFDGTDWALEDTLTVTGGGNLGFSVAVSGDVIAAGAAGDSSVVSGNGAVYVFRYNGVDWDEEAMLILPNTVVNDRFGYGVAVEGNRLVAGGRGPNGGSGLSSGRVMTYRYTGASWVEQTELVASQGTDTDAFGQRVDLSGDVVIVSCRFAEPSFAGAAYVYRLDGNNWVEEQVLGWNGSFAHSGADVGVSGNTVVVGRPGDNVGSETGSADVYEFDGNQWNYVTELTPSNGDELDHFGESVAIEGDFIIVGADQDDDNGAEAGAAYIYMRGDGSWPEVAKLLASDGESADEFGETVEIGPGGAIAGARLHDLGIQNEGSAYVYSGISDCTGSGVLDLCEIETGAVDDLNGNGTPDACECPWDLDGSGGVGINDFLDLLAAWGPNPGHPADFNGDDVIGITDFLILLANWGPCP